MSLQLQYKYLYLPFPTKYAENGLIQYREFIFQEMNKKRNKNYVLYSAL